MPVTQTYIYTTESRVRVEIMKRPPSFFCEKDNVKFGANRVAADSIIVASNLKMKLMRSVFAHYNIK